MIGEFLKKANEWFDRAISMEEQGKQSMMEKCLEKAIALEIQGIAAGESWK